MSFGPSPFRSLYYWYWLKKQYKKFVLDLALAMIPEPEMEGFFNKCKNCGKMKLCGFRCNCCFYTDPDEPHHDLCMCVFCMDHQKPKDTEHAPDSAEAVSGKDLTEWDDLGEAG